ncbi:MAG: insulinase family protein [Oscillospiraceae bacterium]|nr:insulinase family protein [Oscillospiraceae bacterium]
MSERFYEERRDGRLGERYFRWTHPTGLEIQVLPREGYTTAYAMFSAKYGSIDTTIFRAGGGAADGTPEEIPEGTAHFLEHKLFESEDLDAFERFAKTGASANAYTSFDKTAYLFSCADHFEENLAILLDFVQSPYFTQATVEKEQGIIGQEIRMYQDVPGWAVMFQLLRVLYRSHPVGIEVAGTEASIALITAEMLHDCYRNFYNPKNMVLTAAGNITPEAVRAVADRVLRPAEGQPARRKPSGDQGPPVRTFAEREMSVAQPTFMLGWKEPLESPELPVRQRLLADLVLDALAGESSPLYEQLMDEGLINAGFDPGFLCGFDYACALFEGESKDPRETARRIEAEVARALAEGMDPEAFERARRKRYGRMVMEFNDIDSLAGRMADAYFAGEDLFARAAACRELTAEDADRRLREMFRPGFSALSVIWPKKE